MALWPAAFRPPINVAFQTHKPSHETIDSTESRSPRSRKRSLSSHHSRPPRGNLSSDVVSPGTLLYSYPRSSLCPSISQDPPIPFAAAAQQLDCTVRRAILFFDNFHLTFRESSDGLKFHATKDLLDKIWQSQINASRMNPTHDWYNRKSRRNNNSNGNQNGNHNQDFQENRGYSQQTRYGNNNGNNGGNSRSSSPNTEVLSFREFQHQVLSRVEALIHSKLPALPMAATCLSPHCSPSSSSAFSGDDDHDEEPPEARARQHAATTLVRKVRNCYDDLGEAMEMMGRDHVYAKQAIREMKVVKQQLVTYSQGWDEKWEDRGGWDSDVEEVGEEEGGQQ